MVFWRITYPQSTLHGTAVVIRPPAKEDKEQWLAIRRQSRDFLKHWEPAWPIDALTEAAFDRRFRHMDTGWKSGKYFGFFIERKADNQLLGGITLSNVRYGVVQSTSMGYWIAKPFSRKGYMTEAMQLALRFSFERLKLHRVEAACMPHNLASIKLLQKTGFQQEGMARQYLRINNQWQDHLTFAILRDDFLNP